MKELPDLPRVLRKKESQFSNGLFRKWIMSNPRISTAFEIKDTRGKNSFKLSEIKDKQIAWGMSIKGNKGTLIRVEGLNGEPDYIYARNMPSYVVIKYPLFFCLIDIEMVALEKRKSSSLSGKRAKEIAIIVIHR